LDGDLEACVIGLAGDVLAARVNVADEARAIDDEADARERALLVAGEPPGAQRLPLRIDGEGEGEAIVPGGALEDRRVGGSVVLVVVEADHDQAAAGVALVEVSQRWGTRRAEG